MASMVPPIYQPSLTRTFGGPTEESIELTKGCTYPRSPHWPTAAAVYFAAIEHSAEVEEGVFVVVFCDSGERYLSEDHLWRIRMLLIPTNIRTDIEAHAEQGYPHEGWVFGWYLVVNTVQVLRSLVNERVDTHNRYQVSALHCIELLRPWSPKGGTSWVTTLIPITHHNTLIMTESMLCPIFPMSSSIQMERPYHTVLEIVEDRASMIEATIWDECPAITYNRGTVPTIGPPHR